jgi:hypothetical protein
MLSTKIEAAKCGKPVTIYPQDLFDAEFERNEPVTIADLITLCESFNLQYTLIDSPTSFLIYKS